MTEFPPQRCRFHSPATPCCRFLCVSPTLATTSSEEPLPPNVNSSPVNEKYVSPESPASAPASKRFRFASDQELEELTSGVVPENTSRSTKWALKTFHSWCEARKAQTTENVPSNLLTNPDVTLLNKYISMFAVEARKSHIPLQVCTIYYVES